MWLAAVAGRLPRFARHVWGRAVGKASPPAPISAFDHLQHVLRLAEECPRGPAGDDIRRGACELVEADSWDTRRAGRRRMRNAIAGVERRRSVGMSRTDDPGAMLVGRLSRALRVTMGAQRGSR
jgi:hypothetical protein